jgi:two-component system, NarL family, nitrate/nitrite response regulator NarL
VTRKIRVGIVDSHPVVRTGLKQLFLDSAELEVVAEGENIHEAVTIAQNFSPDVIVIEIFIPGNGLETIRVLARTHPEVRIVTFTASLRVDHAQAALTHGATGYAIKSETPAEILRCIKMAASGRRFLSAEIASKVLAGDMSADGAQNGQSDNIERVLTGRENDVAMLLGIGRSNKEIADALEISEKTVKHHMSVIMEKLNVRNRTEAALIVARMVERKSLQ